MKIFRFIAVLLMIVMVTGTALPALSARADEPAYAAPEPFRAEAVLLAETTTGTELFEQNSRVRRSPDALAKLMTLLLAAEAVARGELADGQVLEDLFSALVGNSDASADAVAVTVSGSVEAFVAAMNARAAQLGCTDTNFTNTSGAADSRQYTTAYDLFLIACAGIKLPVFIEVAGAQSHNGATNANQMLLPQRTKYYYKYCVFGSVSASYEGGLGAVEYAERDGMNTVAVILGSRDEVLEDESTQLHNLSEARRLLEWGHQNYAWRHILTSLDLVARAAVELGDGADYVNLRPVREVTMLLRRDLPNDTVTREIHVYSEERGTPLTAPVEAETELGEVVLLLNGEEIDRVTLVANTTVRLQRVKLFTSRLKSMLGGPPAKLIILLVAIFFTIYLVIVIRSQSLRARHVREQSAADAAQRQADADAQNRQ